MFRRSIKITPKAQFDTATQSGGIDILAFDPRTCMVACDQGGTNAPPEDRKAGDGIWEPHINSISLATRTDPPSVPAGPAPADPNIEITVMLWSWYEYQEALEVASGATNVNSVLRNRLLLSQCRQYLAGFWLGDPGRREFYASNDGKGYLVPRAIVPASRCIDFQNWWVLAIQWDIDFDSIAAALTVDYEWRRGEL